jgi:hypothetical protein
MEGIPVGLVFERKTTRSTEARIKVEKTVLLEINPIKSLSGSIARQRVKFGFFQIVILPRDLPRLNTYVEKK